jgi:diaminopimelate decarboxylase
VARSDGTTGTPQLAPRVDETLRSALDQTHLLHDLVAALGSPLNLVLPERIAENVAAFRAVYRRHHLAGQVWYAHKANQSSALVRALAATEAGIDVASVGELQHAAGAGFAPDRIMATGPKNRAFLWLAARLGVLVNADSVAELAELAAVVAAHRLPRVRVLARMSGFAGPGARVLSRRSRFGVPVADLDALVGLVGRHAGELDLVGVA